MCFVDHLGGGLTFSRKTDHPTRKTSAGLQRGGSGRLDSLFPFLSGASRVADYAAVSRVVRWS